MSVAAIRRVGGFQLRGPSPLLLMKSDQQLVALVRAGHAGAFDVVVGRYQSRLASFCRHMLGSREDAEDVLQEVLASAFDAMRTDSRPIELAPWLYRLARNRSLNHLRAGRARVPRFDGGDDALSGQPAAAGQSTAERVDQREQFRLIVSDIRQLAESQRSALVLREVEGLSHAQIAAVMETTVPAVKGLLVRARGTLAECVEARTINCEDVRYELCEEAEGLRRLSGGAKRHFKQCERCSTYAGHLRTVDRAMSSLAPAGLLELLKHLLMPHAGTHGGGAAASGGAAAGGGATAGTVVGGGASAGSAVGVGLGGPLTTAFGGLAVKATTGLTMAALLTAGATHLPVGASHPHPSTDSPVVVPAAAPALPVGMLLSHSAPATASLGRLFTAAPARPAGKALLGRPHAHRLRVLAPAAPTAAPLAPAPRPAAIAAPLPAAPAPAVIPAPAAPSESAPVTTTAGGSNSTSQGSSSSSTPSQDSSGATTTEGSSSSGASSGSSGGSSGSGTGGSSSSSSSGSGSSSGSTSDQSGTAPSGSGSGSSSTGSGSSSSTSGSGSTTVVSGSLPANVAAVVSTTVTVTTVTVTSTSNPSDGTSSSTSAASPAPTPTATSAAGTSTDAARTESTTGQ